MVEPMGLVVLSQPMNWQMQLCLWWCQPFIYAPMVIFNVGLTNPDELGALVQQEKSEGNLS